ncbi:MAG: PIG-L family deacetylase [Acidimicrobiia bacterium]|nr:PIG-L family deacetylase [Acidimicrobiia bacterium]
MIELRNPGAQVYVPDGIDPVAAVRRTTHLAVGAHQDDIPIMAHDGIQQCFGRPDQWFLGITVTDGAGSPRSDLYGNYTDSQMREVRSDEEKKAAFVGEYSAAVLLDYPSTAAKDGSSTAIVDEIARIISEARPDVIYTHNLADKHDTHVAVALRTIAAIRKLPHNTRPQAVYGCEVWRDLDWMADADKVAFDVSAHANLSAALMGVYDSQISGGKRYDLATEGRRLAHATFSESHSVDQAKALIYAMDLTPLVTEGTDPATFVADHIWRMEEEISDRIARLAGNQTQA